MKILQAFCIAGLAVAISAATPAFAQHHGGGGHGWHGGGGGHGWHGGGGGHGWHGGGHGWHGGGHGWHGGGWHGGWHGQRWWSSGAWLCWNGWQYVPCRY